MATYTSDVTNDPFGPMQLYKPDYQFLTQVYGSAQADFDRGFNYVKSIFNSQLNSQLTSQDNQKHRQAVFKKLSESLKDSTTLDFSNPANIQYATKLIEPISNDREFAYDMAFTQRQQSEAQKLEATRTSLDPKISSQYNDFSRRAIEFATQDMRNSKRGDGSILKIAPQEFVPFQDIVADLNKAAADQKLNIHVESADNHGYIIKQENGKLAYKPFTNWAMQAIGNKYDRQFQQQGYVEAESMIRGKMQSDELSREDAIKTFTPKITNLLYSQAIQDGSYSDSKLKEVDLKIQKFKDKYGSTGIDPNSSAAKELIKLYKEKNNHTADLAQAKAEEINLRENGEQYVTSNLYNIFTNQAKKQTALNWAINQADLTSKQEITNDATWGIKFKEANENTRFNKQLALDEQKLRHTIENDAVKNQIDKLRLMYGDGNLPKQTKTGNAPSSIVEVPATKILQNTLQKNQETIFDMALAPSGGLINVLYQNDKNDQGVINPIINKIRNIAEGQKLKLSESELKSLTDFGKRTGITIHNPNDPASAAYALRSIAFDVYNKSLPILEAYKKSGQHKEILNKVETYKKLRDSFKNFSDMNNAIESNYDKLSGYIIGNDGKVLDKYKGIKVIGYTKKGKPLFDFSNVNPDVIKELSTKVDDVHFQSRTHPLGSTMQNDNLSVSEYSQLFKYNSNLSEDDKKTLQDIGVENIKNIFGKSVDVTYDAGTEEVIVKLKADTSVAKTHNIKIKQNTYDLKIPYSVIKSNPDLFPSFAKYINDNTITAYPGTFLSAFKKNPNTVVSSQPEVKAMGLNYNVYGGKNHKGEYGMYVTGTAHNPKTDKQDYFEHFEPGDASDENLIHNTENFLNKLQSEYGSYLMQHDNSFKSSEYLQDYDAFVKSIK